MNTGSTLNFSDLFKSSFLKSSLSSFSILDVSVTLGIAFLIALFIYVIYKKTFNGVMYSKNFNISLIGMSLITTFIIMGVTSNLVLSLGMVGALSIVRFRTAIKDPIDIVYLFWAISVGIITGAGLYMLAIFGSLVLGLMLLGFSWKTTSEIPFMLVASCTDAAAERSLLSNLALEVKKMQVRSKAVRAGQGIEVTIEVRLRNQDTDFVNYLAKLEGVESVVLVSYNGELAV